jgi:hypothetical protein
MRFFYWSEEAGRARKRTANSHREISRVNEPFGFAQLFSNFSVDFEWRCLAEDLVLARKPYRKGRLSTIDLLNKITCSVKQRIFFQYLKWLM